MRLYQHFASVLTQLVTGFMVNGYMPMFIENIGHSDEGNRDFDDGLFAKGQLHQSESFISLKVFRAELA